MEDELEMATVRHRPEALELLEAQSKFTKKELQILYRGFKNVRTSFFVLPSPRSQRSIEKREDKRAIYSSGSAPHLHISYQSFLDVTIVVAIWTMTHLGTPTLIHCGYT